MNSNYNKYKSSKYRNKIKQIIKSSYFKYIYIYVVVLIIGLIMYNTNLVIYKKDAISALKQYNQNLVFENVFTDKELEIATKMVNTNPIFFFYNEKISKLEFSTIFCYIAIKELMETGISGSDLVYNSSNISEKRDINKNMLDSEIDAEVKSKDKNKKVLENRDIFNDNNIGYIRILSFNKLNSDHEFQSILEKLKNKDYLVIDLRDNHGGYSSRVATYLDCFLDSKVEMFSHKYKNNYKERYVSKTNKKYKFRKIFVLVNKGTASASEIFSLAMKEFLKENVILIGNETTGKFYGAIRVNEPSLYMYVPSFNWYVGENKTTTDLNQYLEKYSDKEFNDFEDYKNEVYEIINKI